MKRETKTFPSYELAAKFLIEQCGCVEVKKSPENFTSGYEPFARGYSKVSVENSNDLFVSHAIDYGANGFSVIY